MNQPYSQAKTNVNSLSAALLQVKLLGSPQFIYAGERLQELRIQKAQALLIYLVVEGKLNPGRELAKEKLIDLLWPGMPAESALQNLRQTLYQLRKAVPGVLTKSGEKVPLLETNRKTVWLHPDGVIDTDLDVLLAQEEMPAAGVPLPDGIFLDNFYVPGCEAYEQWIEEVRKLLMQRLTYRLQKQAETLMKAGDSPWALVYLRHLVTLEPLHENGQLLLMEALDQEGQRTEALRAYQRYRQLLQDELGTTPGVRLEALYEKIRQQSPGQPEPASTPLPGWTISLKATLWGAILLAIVLGTGAVLVWMRMQQNTVSKVTEPAASIAVLPFQNYSSQPFLADGLVDDITTQLAHLPGIRVTSSISSLQFKSSDKTAREIGEELNAEYLLKGSVQKLNEQIKVNVQLIHAPSNAQQWGTSVMRPTDELFAIQNDVAKQVAGALHIPVSPASTLALNKLPTRHMEAYEAFLEGGWAYNTKNTPENIYGALKQYEKAIALDTTFVAAQEYLAYTLTDLGGGWGDQSIASVYPHIKAILEKTQAQAFYPHIRYETQAWVYVWYYRIAEAEQLFRKAVEANPNSNFALPALSMCLSWQGKFEEAVQKGIEAIEISPFTVYSQQNLTIAYMLSGAYDKALLQGEKALRLNPHHVHSLKILAQTYTLQGNYQKAIQLLQEAIRNEEVADDDPFLLGRLGVAYALRGEREKARKILAVMEQEYSKKRRHFDYFIAMVYQSLGETDKALYWLETAYANLEPELNWVHQDPEFSGLRQHPRYLRLANQMKDTHQPPLF